MTLRLQPLPFRWTGEAFVPHPQAKARAVAQYEVNEIYPLAPEEVRSEKSHNHEFAFIATAWKNLPEGLADIYPSAEHLRKRALIDCGFYDEQIIDAGSNAAALRVATGVRSFPGEDFSLVVVRGAYVVIRRAKSQSRRAMGNAMFHESKERILSLLAGLIGVTPEQLAGVSLAAEGGARSQRAPVAA